MSGNFSRGSFSGALGGFSVDSTAMPSGGHPYPEPRRKTKEQIRREREQFGIPDEARIAIEAAARRQALHLEQDEQKRFEELEREMQLRGIEWNARYLEAMNTMRERLIEEEIGKLMKAKRDEDEVMYLLSVVAAAA